MQSVLTDLFVCRNPILGLPPRLRVVWLVTGLSIVAAIAVIGTLVAPGAGPPRDLSGTVVAVADATTIHVDVGGRIEEVRYIGVDAPALRHPTRGEEPGAREAADVNRRLVEGRAVRVELDVEERDAADRLLGYVWVGEVMVNAEIVRLGHARVTSMRPNLKHEILLLTQQREAREARRGLWGQR
ncbi:MAG: thermonuclease family protein [Candidatus Rokubacteria bacterium]|nr:thermonuclease family protein [Candidatus Rokubacteria bacterium]